MLQRRQLKRLNWKYALGEVLLIFIGINLAIQFNNWNEARKLAEEETRVLKSISKDLEIDLAANQLNIRALTIELNYLQQILDWTEGATVLPADSIGHLLPFLIKDHTVNIQSTGYHSLVNRGFSLDEKEELRKMLIHYYDDLQESTQELTRNSNKLLEFLIPYLTQNFLHFDFWGMTPAVPKDLNALRQDPEFKVLVQLAYYSKDRTLVIYEAISQEIGKLQEQLKSEGIH